MSYSYDPISTFCGNVVGWFIGRGPPREGPSLHEGRPTMVVMGFRPIPDANTNIYMYIYIYMAAAEKNEPVALSIIRTPPGMCPRPCSTRIKFFWYLFARETSQVRTAVSQGLLV